MFQFVQPIWLFATAGIIVPIIIHLWNQQPGKTLKVGSIVLITASSKQYSRRLQLSDILLLLLRCLLIILVAFALANPLWRHPFDTIKQKGWVLADPQHIGETYAKYKSEIDSLLHAGFEFHAFSEGFKKQSLDEALKSTRDSIITVTPMYWDLLTALDDRIPPTLPVYLFTESRLRNFRGNRPRISAAIKWNTYIPADSAHLEVADAFQFSQDSLRVILAKTEIAGNSYSLHDISTHNPGNSDLHTLSKNGNLSVSFNDEKPVPADTASLQVTIFTDKYKQDAAYLQAALEAITQYSKRKIRLSAIANPNAVGENQDWLFWLSDLPLPLHSGAANLWSYEKGKQQEVHSWITGHNSKLSAEKLALFKYIDANKTTRFTDITWEDGYGHPILAYDTTNDSKHYHFFSHFDPSWNDMCLNSAFPALIYTLVYSKQQAVPTVDSINRRAIDNKQVQPIILPTGKNANREKWMQVVNLSDFFWMAIILLFFFERLISFRHSKYKRNA